MDDDTEIDRLIDEATNYAGTMEVEGLQLAPGESCYAEITGCALMGERATTTWHGASHGISIPTPLHIAHFPVRYRVGAARGHVVKGEPVPTVEDHGTFFATDKRLLFIGGAKTVEVHWPSVVSLEHGPGWTTVAQANRPTFSVFYGSAAGPEAAFRIDLANAVARGQRAELVAKLRTSANAS
jgi:hypothetical protein